MCLGIPGQIVAISDEARNLGVAAFSGVRREVDLTCVATGPLDELIGKWVLVHVGFAMSVIDEEEARLTLDALAQLGEAEEEMQAMRRSAAMLEGGA
jgi:hydrogenase expression/formation protein HypC